jgi:hypothetical protein
VATGIGSQAIDSFGRFRGRIAGRNGKIEKIPGSTGKTRKQASALRFAARAGSSSGSTSCVGVELEDEARRLVVEFAHPSAYDDRGEDVAKEVIYGTDLGQEAVGQPAGRRGTATRQEVAGMLLV